MDSAHRSASFRGSCIVAPRHPVTKLPTSIVERKSFDFSPLNDFCRDANENKEEENKNLNDSTKSKLQKRPRSTPNKSRTISCGAQRRSNKVHSNSSFHESSIEGLQTLSKDDDQFFRRLQALKEENKRTLKHLEKLYDFDRLDMDKRNVEQRNTLIWENVDNEKRNDDTEGFCDSEGNAVNAESKKSNNINTEQSNTDNVTDMNKYGSEEKVLDPEISDESSEDSLDEQLRVKPPKSHINILPSKDSNYFRGRSSSYDIIASMWEDFSVDDVLPYDSVHRSVNRSSDWSPTVTIPEPFQMTIREERKNKQKNKKIERIKDELLLKRLEEEAELRKRIVPTPVPASTFLPLYSEFQAEREKKREYIRDISKHILKSTEKPFSFLKREAAKSKIEQGRGVSKKAKSRKKETFKANPFPNRIFDLTLADKQAEEEEYRKIKIKLRSEEMLLSSSLPPNMKTRNDPRYYRAGHKTNQLKAEIKKRREKSFQPVIHHDIPDYEEMQKKVEAAIEARKNKNMLTICEPFELRTAKVPSRRSKFRESYGIQSSDDVQMGGEQKKHRPASPNISVRSHPIDVSPAYRLTESARLRQEHIKNSLVKEKEKERMQYIQEKKKKKELSKLQKVVAKKAYAHHPSPYRERETVEKLTSFREADLHRSREYKEFLQSIEQKNQERPLLFERESQTNAKLRAQKRYEEILRQAGIEDSMKQSINATGGNDYENDEEEGGGSSDLSSGEESIMQHEINCKYGLVDSREDGKSNGSVVDDDDDYESYDSHEGDTNNNKDKSWMENDREDEGTHPDDISSNDDSYVLEG